MKYRIQILKAFLRKEILQILRDPRMRIVLFVAPLIQLTLFGVALSTETRNIKLAVVAKPNDVLIQDLARNSFSTRWFIPAKVLGNDPFEWISSGQADAVLIAPEGGLGRAIAEGRGKIQLLINAENSLRAQSIEGYLKTISTQIYSKLNIQKGPRTGNPKAITAKPKIKGN